jgi:hypothetical protein
MLGKFELDDTRRMWAEPPCNVPNVKPIVFFVIIVVDVTPHRSNLLPNVVVCNFKGNRNGKNVSWRAFQNSKVGLNPTNAKKNLHSSSPSCGMLTVPIDGSVLVDPTMNPSHFGLQRREGGKGRNVNVKVKAKSQISSKPIEKRNQQSKHRLTDSPPGF